MKFRFLAIAAALVACAFSANAQQEEKLGNDWFIGISGGVISTTTNHMNTPQPYFAIEAGKYFSPVWGGRITIAGPVQKFDRMVGSWYIQNEEKWTRKQYFGELNLDGILNLSQLFSKKSFPRFDAYLFAGPTMNIATKCTQFTGQQTSDGTLVVEEANNVVARFGATAGLGLAYNITKKIALGVEYRAAVTPSIFGDASKGRTWENTNRFTLRLAYTFGGRLGKDGYAAKYGKNTVKEVVKEVEKEVIKEVEKEVVKEVRVVDKVYEKAVNTANLASSAVFFELGKSVIDNKDKVRLMHLATAIKADKSDAVYEISGHADKATGSAQGNMILSEKRAQAVYDYLVSQGVDKAKLKIVANGGVDNLFFDEASLSRVVIIQK